MQDHRRYLAALRAACAQRPDAHVHQLAALDRELTLAATDDPAAYALASGDVFEPARALALDRLRNEARVATAVGDVRRARAAALEYEHLLGATGHADWVARLIGAAELTEAQRADAAACASAFATLQLAVLALQSAIDDAEQQAARAAAAEAHATLAARLNWADRSYAHRTPWAPAGRDRIASWLAELGLAAPAAAAEPSADALAAIDAAAARWLGAPVPAAAARPDAAETAAARAAAEAAAEPLRARAREGLARQDVWPDPLIEHHWRALLAALDAVATPTEAELIALHADACLAIEGDWNAALLAVLLGPLKAACQWAAWPDERSRAAVERAAGATHALVGLGPRAILELPRIASFVERVLLPLAAHDPGELGAELGEAGFEAVRYARVVFEGRAPDVRALISLLDESGAPEPPPDPRPVFLWGRRIELADLAEALAAPQRPRL